jgi:ribonuclease PH
MIGRSLRAVTDLQALGERTLYVDCDVIQADGGTRTAAITGGYVALVEAISEMKAGGVLEGDPISGQLAAVSCGLVNGEALLDLCYREDSSAATDMNVVMTKDGRLVEIQATAERTPFTPNQMNGLLDLATKGIAELLALQTAVLGDLVASE